MDEEFWRGSGDCEQDVCAERRFADADRNHAAAIRVGRRGFVDTGEAEPGSDREDRSRGISAALVFTRTFEAGRFHEGSGSGSDGGGEQPGESVPDGVSEAFFGACGVTDGFGGGKVSNDALHRAGSGGIVAAYRLRKRGEFAASAGDDERKGVCDPVG